MSRWGPPWGAAAKRHLIAFRRRKQLLQNHLFSDLRPCRIQCVYVDSVKAALPWPQLLADVKDRLASSQ